MQIHHGRRSLEQADPTELMGWRPLPPAQWRADWANEVQAAQRLTPNYNWLNGTPGVLWPLVRKFAQGHLRLRVTSHGDVIEAQSISDGLPQCVRDRTGLLVFPRLRFPRATRQKLSKSTRICLMLAEEDYQIDLLWASSALVPSSELALIIREATASS